MSKIRILVADDHAVVRAGMCSLLENCKDMQVIGEASCGAEAVAQVKEHAPDMVLLDITMPGTVATSVIEQILTCSPTTRVLVLTMHDDPLYLRSVVGAGALGYVTKDSAPDTLVEAIRTVHGGRRYVAANSCREGDADWPTQAAAPASRGTTDAGPLSQREKQVLALLAQGHTYHEISQQLAISPNSVGTYRSRIAHKLGVESRADLVRVAVQYGLVKSEG